MPAQGWPGESACVCDGEKLPRSLPELDVDVRSCSSFSPRCSSTDRNGFEVPGKSEIDLVPHEVQALADALRAQGEARGLVAGEIAEKHLGVSANATPHLKAAVNRIEGGICRRYHGRGAEERDWVPIMCVACSHIQRPSARKLAIQSRKRTISDGPEEYAAAAAQKVVVPGTNPEPPRHFVMKQCIGDPGDARVGRLTGADKVWIVNKTDLRASAYLKKEPLSDLPLICTLKNVVPNAYRESANPQIIEPIDDGERISTRTLIPYARLETPPQNC